MSAALWRVKMLYSVINVPADQLPATLSSSQKPKGHSPVGTPEAKGIVQKQTADQKIQKLQYLNRKMQHYYSNSNSAYLCD